MTLIKFEPLKDLNYLSERIKKILSEYPEQPVMCTSLPVDISYDEKNIYIDCELPGMKKEDINITIQDNILTLKGVKNDNQNEERNYYRTERSFGSFTRNFTLPEEINPDSVDAHYENGVLKIKIEKFVEHPVKERFIEVK